MTLSKAELRIRDNAVFSDELVQVIIDQPFDKSLEIIHSSEIGL